MKRMAWGLFVLLLFSALPALAATNDAAVKYSVEMIVSEYGVVSVSETLTFDEPPSEGIFVYRIPAKIADQQSSVEGLIVEGCDYASETTDLGVNISLHDPEGEVYITYSRSILQDGNENHDMLAVCLLPSISLPIRSATATVLMPSRFEQQDIAFFGLQDISYDYYATSQQLSGSLLAPLPPQTQLQAVFTLPQGYFAQMPSPLPSISAGQQGPQMPDHAIVARIGGYILAAMCAVSLLLFVFSRGSENNGGRAARFDPSQAGYIARGYVRSGDLAGLLPYWISRGILFMELLPNKRIHFVQTKPLPEEAPSAHRMLLQALLQGKTEITLGSLSQTFRKEIRQIRTQITNGYDSAENRIFTKSSERVRTVSVAFLYLSHALLFYCALPLEPVFIRIYSALVLPMVCLFALLPLLRRLYAFRIVPAIVYMLTVLGLALYFAAILAICLWAVRLQPQLHIMAAFSSASVLFHALIFLFSRKRTDAGMEQLHVLKGILNEIQHPRADSSPADLRELYAYAIALRMRMADNDPWGNEITTGLRGLQKVWNWLERPITQRNWMPYY